MYFKNSISQEQIKMAEEAFLLSVDRVIDNFKIIPLFVHDGRFHLDDCMATAIFKMLCLKYGIDVVVKRTRCTPSISIAPDGEIIHKHGEGSRIYPAFDVGNEYDPRRLKFDHHQHDFEHDWLCINTDGPLVPSFPMAACGLVWGHLGHLVVDDHEVYDAIQQWLVQVDCWDNGFPDVFGKTESTTLAGVVGMLQAEDIYSDDQEKCFHNAVKLCMWLLTNKIRDLKNLYEFENMVLDALEDVEDGILILEKGGNWKEVAARHWDEFQAKGVKVCLFYSGKNEEWRVQTMSADPKAPMSIACQAPVNLLGRRDKELEEACGIEGVSFVHKEGFLGGGYNYEATHALAKYWVANA